MMIKNKEIEGAEYGVDSRYASDEERKTDGKKLMEARLQRLRSLSVDQIIKAKLLQLKFQMEEYMNSTSIVWYQIYYHEKVSSTMARQNEWGPEIEKDVNTDRLIKA